MTREIQLTRGFVALVDDEDYDYLMQWKWHATSTDRGGYAARQERPIPRQNQKPVRMHVDLMKPPIGMVVDHINGVRWDNRKENLRICTPYQNSLNKVAQVHKSKSSIFRGVTWDKASQKWMAQISIKMKRRQIGRYESEVEAALAYNEVCVAAFGEFANPNEIEEILDAEKKVHYSKLVKKFLTT